MTHDTKHRFLARYAQANDIAVRFASRVRSIPWRLELAKAVLSEGFAFLSDGDEPSPRARGFRARFSWASNHSGKVLSVRTERFALALVFTGRFGLSCGAAAFALAGTLVRAVAARRVTGWPENALYVAVHPEITNRTRHVLSMAARSGQNVVILLLGRPRGSATTIAKLFKEARIDDAYVVLPISLLAGVAAVPACLASVTKGAMAIVRTGFAQPWRDEVATVYRILLGEVQAAWCARNLPSIDAVYFGHAGTGDTAVLEGALQSRGTKTIHCVHGISGGYNFASNSSLGIFQCGYDADKNAGYGVYGRTGSRPIRRALSPLRGASGWLILTNYVHPTNPFAQQGADEFEREMLDGVHHVATELGVSPDEILWRPHPAFWRMPQSITAPLLEEARGLGIAVWKEGSPAHRLQDFSVVVCCPTTMVIDALTSGVMPIVYSPSPLSDDVVYASLATVARNRSELKDRVSFLDEEENATRAFKEAHATIRPGQGDWDITWVRELVNS